MDDETDGTIPFDAFVRRCAPDLARLAVLLTDEPEHADDLVRTALGRACRSGGHSYAVARRALVARAVRGRRPSTVQEIVEPAEGLAPPPAPEDDAVAAALATLPARIRAVVVLRSWEELSEAATADVLGCSTGDVAADTTSGLVRLQAALGADFDERLERHLARRAGRVAPPRPDLSEAVAAASRQVRRRRTAILAGPVAIALSLGCVAVGSRLLEAPPSRPEVVPAPAEVDLGIYEVPTRGSLAGDESFVEDVRSIEWSAPMGWEGTWLAPEESDRRVLFAGEVPDGSRWALVMGRVGFQLLYVWFTGPAAASGATLQPAAPPGRGGPDEPMTLMDQGRPDSTLVVVGLPGDEVAFSPDGSAWQTVPTDDGVAVGRVPPPASLADAELRITRAGGDVVHRSALVHLRPTGPYLPPGAGPGPAEDPDGRQYGDRMRDCLLSSGWVVTAAAGGGAFLAGADLGDPLRLLAFQQDRQQCEAVLGYRD